MAVEERELLGAMSRVVAGIEVHGNPAGRAIGPPLVAGNHTGARARPMA